MPARWNGTLLLYSHGLYPDGFRPPEVELVAQSAGKPWLLEHGYALAASEYAKPSGWVVPEALHDQMALLDWFDATVGEPRRVISWGKSGGGLTSVLLAERNPRRIDGVLSLCGVVGGGVGAYNQLLALANALASLPGWSRAHEPRSTDVAQQVVQQSMHHQRAFARLIWGLGRPDIEARAGGNPSWNTGVDYGRQLARSSERALVEAAYREAGIDLGADIVRLGAAPRIAPDAGAVRWFTRYGQLSGRAPAPVVTLHPVGDGVAPEHQRRYAEPVERSGDPSRLRQLFVNRGGHCMHTAAEEITALRALLVRVDSGRWTATDPVALRAAATRIGPEQHLLLDWTVDRTERSEPAFIPYKPGRFLR